MDNLNSNCKTPAVSIRESEKEIFLNVEMPGLQKENVGLEVTGDELTITGKASNADIKEGYTTIYRERNLSDYYRKFKLNVDVDRDGINAQYQNGVLNVRIPKSEEAKPKRIEIK